MRVMPSKLIKEERKLFLNLVIGFKFIREKKDSLSKGSPNSSQEEMVLFNC